MFSKFCYVACMVAFFGTGVLLTCPALAAPPDGSDGVALCTQHLQSIHRALMAYKHDHGLLPDHLSDLIPQYLPDKSALHCPNDPDNGNMGSEVAFSDPKMRVSYSYEFNGDVSGGLPSPLGPFPKPDIQGASWGSWRLVNTQQERVYGPNVPVMRCFHHRPAQEARDAGKEDLILNLMSSGKVVQGGIRWEEYPDARRALLENLDHDLLLGPGKVKSDWYLWRFNEHVMDLGDPKVAAPYLPQIRRIVDHLSAVLPDLTDEQRVAHHIIARFDFALGQYQKILPLLDAAARYDGADWHPIFEAQLRGETYHALKQYEKEIVTYQYLLDKRPDVPSYMTSIADAYDAWGKPDKAKVWRAKADPGLLLVGKTAPDGPLPLLAGNPTHLAERWKGKKALLVNFWFCGCYPCKREMPHLQKLYQALKDKGFDMVCIDFGDSKEQVQKFIDAGNYTFAVALGARNNAIFDPYSVQNYPTNYLLDGDGKVVWRGVGFGPETLRDLPAALAGLGLR